MLACWRHMVWPPSSHAMMQLSSYKIHPCIQVRGLQKLCLRYNVPSLQFGRSGSAVAQQPNPWDNVVNLYKHMWQIEFLTNVRACSHAHAAWQQWLHWSHYCKCVDDCETQHYISRDYPAWSLSQVNNLIDCQYILHDGISTWWSLVVSGFWQPKTCPEDDHIQLVCLNSIYWIQRKPAHDTHQSMRH